MGSQARKEILLLGLQWDLAFREVKNLLGKLRNTPREKIDSWVQNGFHRARSIFFDVMNSSSRWYYSSNGKSVGPFDAAAIRQMIHAGITPP